MIVTLNPTADHVILDLISTTVSSDYAHTFTMTPGEEFWLPAWAAIPTARNPTCPPPTPTPGVPTLPLVTGCPRSASASARDGAAADEPEATGSPTGGADAEIVATPSPEPTTDAASMRGGGASLKSVLGGLLVVAFSLGGL